MNAQRRKIRDEIIGQLECMLETLNDLKSAEEDAYDNMPENLQESERGQRISDNVDVLEAIIDELENQKDELEEVD